MSTANTRMPKKPPPAFRPFSDAAGQLPGSIVVNHGPWGRGQILPPRCSSISIIWMKFKPAGIYGKLVPPEYPQTTFQPYNVCHLELVRHLR